MKSFPEKSAKSAIEKESPGSQEWIVAEGQAAE